MSENTKKAIEKLGYETMTEIQALFNPLISIDRPKPSPTSSAAATSWAPQRPAPARHWRF